MINHISQNENTKDDFSKAIKELQIGKLLRNSNISKSWCYFYVNTPIC